MEAANKIILAAFEAQKEEFEFLPAGNLPEAEKLIIHLDLVENHQELDELTEALTAAGWTTPGIQDKKMVWRKPSMFSWGNLTV